LTIEFTYGTNDSVYINTRKSGDDIILAPVAEYSKNVTDWEVTGSKIAFSDQEIATITNDDSSVNRLSEILTVSQSAVGDILFRCLVKAENVAGEMGSGWELYADIRHTDDTWEYSKSLKLPTGSFGWSQFTLTLHSDAEKTIKYVYPYLMLKDRIGTASFKTAEVIDLTRTDTSNAGEAYSDPACKYEQTTPVSPQGELNLSHIAFAYGDLANINQEDSPSHSIAKLGNFEYLVCGEPGTLTDAELYITDSIKADTKIFGYVAMGAYPGELPSMITLKAQVDRILANEWFGVFLDQFGYDYSETRARQNELVAYIHELGLIAFVNAWVVDDALGSIVNSSNPDGLAPELGVDDWYLCESFLMSNSGYRDWYPSIEKYLKCKTYKDSLGCKIAALPYKRTATTWDEADTDAELTYLLALSLGFDGWHFTPDLSDDAFLYKDDPDLNLGDELTSSLAQLAPYWYVAQTDTHVIVFNAEDYSPLTYTVYSKHLTQPIPEGDVLHSDDLDTWEEYDAETTDDVGIFVRERTIILEE
jgi:hypothetical protein